MRTSNKLIFVALSFSLISCDKPTITAEDAITIGRKACEAAEKSLIPEFGNRFPIPRKEWQAALDRQEWLVTANPYPFYFLVRVTTSGTSSQCKWGQIDA